MVLSREKIDTSTEAGRSRERQRRLLLTAGASILAKFVQSVTLLLQMHYLTEYLGKERFGLWLTICSFGGMLNFSDFGLGLGVLNEVATAHGKDDKNRAKEVVSSGFFALSAIALFLGLVLLIIFPMVSWNAVLNTPLPEVTPTLAVFLLLFLLNLPLGMIVRVQGGYQEGYLVSGCEAIVSVLSLIGAVVSMYCGFQLPLITLLIVGSLPVVSSLNCIVYFWWSKPWLRPQIPFVSRTAIKRLAKIGLLFFVLQASGAAAFAADNLIISRLFGVAEVAEYGWVSRIFSLVILVISFAVSPLWPAYAEATARGDLLWVKRTLIRSTLAAGIFAVCCSTSLVFLSHYYLPILTSGKINPSYLLLSGWAAWSVMSVLGNSVAMFLNGCNILLMQALLSIVVAVVATTIKIYFAKDYGIAGIVWSTMITYSLIAVPFFTFYLPYSVNKFCGKHAIKST